MKNREPIRFFWGKSLIPLLIPMLLLLSACHIFPLGEAEAECSAENTAYPDNAPEAQYEKAEITYSEPLGKYGFRISGEETKTLYARYWFEASVSEESRSACIQATDRILARLPACAPLPTVCILTASRYGENRYMDGHTLYRSVCDYESVDYTTDVLLAACGAFGHYGSALGYAVRLSEAFGYGSEDTCVFTMPSEEALLDLNLLCFDPAFASESDIMAVRNTACAFVDAYISEHGEDAFLSLFLRTESEDGIEVLRDALSQYYTDKNVDYQPTLLRYGYGGETYDYLMDADAGTFLIGFDWSEKTWEGTVKNPYISENFLHADYVEVKEFFEINVRQMEQFRIFFALDDYNHDLLISFENISGVSGNSWYDLNRNLIHLSNITSLMHEYIHALTMQSPPEDIAAEPWKGEGFARYYFIRYDAYSEKYLNLDYNQYKERPETAETRYLHEFIQEIGRPIDVTRDLPVIWDLYCYSRGYTDPNDNHYTAGASFIHYLVMQYGDRAVIDYIYAEGTLPKAQEELIAEWVSYLNETYAAYSKYEK